MYGLSNVIQEYDTENVIKKAICETVTKNLTKEVSLDALADDLQERLYDYIDESDDLNIDDGSNVRVDFTNEIKRILNEYFS
mgnify:CR=1 FL=1